MSEDDYPALAVVRTAGDSGDNSSTGLRGGEWYMVDIKLLSELKPKDRGEVVKVRGTGSVHRRILDMGVTKGAVIEVQKVAPLGDPIEVKIKGYNLSLRKSEAKNIEVRVI